MEEINNVKQEELTKIQKNDQWKNRRRMAWMSIWMLVIITFVVFKIDISEHNVSILISLIYAFAAIVFAYIGGNIYEFIKLSKQK